ncbi:ABC-2 type transport system ATP-binding protein/lipopolysaccharide transport system ATP-binding protein [Symbiobacterium terraclitae]|uniref:ABC-2 type transport system ATP-binding protein/lipopolysaccharide transport system ATP-binding protein n=1 Tax=Symbiobacterium terraclitae TaxID=557451 RepID=A0ABS4JQS7_9FIRM|nr:ABC-2 type transport system ATP-binding protein/lipopolysaccharide transport system ATP-binding protein [Symbiobacterium terraclitae]
MISLRNVTLQFPVYAKKRGATGRPGRASVGGEISHCGTGGTRVIALDGITIDIPSGARVAVIGHNGAGKSSLLRLIAGIYQPSSGDCRVDGKVSTLFSTSLGMNQDATGYENIYRAGLMLGLRHDEIVRVLPEIIELCDLGSFIDMPFRTYSSGMRMRLGFAIATSMEPDILLIDEVFGAGDRSFMEKAKERFSNMMSKARTVVMVSHSESLAKRFCDRGLWLEKGRLRMYGDLDEVLNAYREHMRR